MIGKGKRRQNYLQCTDGQDFKRSTVQLSDHSKRGQFYVELVYGEAYFDVSPSDEHQGSRFKVVNVDTGNEQFMLRPGQQVGINKFIHEVSVKCVDVASEVAWKDGVFSFKGKPLKEIMKTLSRWYDVNVVFEDESLEAIRFNGVIRKDKKLEDVLAIMKSREINSYRIENKTIIEGAICKYWKSQHS
ncbi:MAG: DUF4974 domain-containing protein [Algicola sp.]|nr:DUF4974 domain-containing protein [Algicola sp.]